MLVALEVEAYTGIIIELSDETKETIYYLTHISGKFSWNKTSESEKKSCMKKSTNDDSKRPFDSMNVKLNTPI